MPAVSTMRAIVCREFGPPGLLSVAELPRPALEPLEVRIRVRAAGANFPDTLIIAGKYQLKPPMPFAPGFEVSGEIMEVGKDVTSRAPGMRVMALTSSGYGAFAEQAVALAAETVLIPSGLDDITATALYTAYGTAYHGLIQRGLLQAGQTVVVLGASGGVGLAAVEIAAAYGARVIAVGRSAEKLAIAKSKGAAEIVAYTEGALGKTIRSLTDGAGADICLDTVGGAAFDEMSRAIAWDGRLLVVGFTSGVISKLPVNLVLLKGYQLVGVYWGNFITRLPHQNARNFEVLARMLADGKITPYVSASYSMDRAAEALTDLLSRNTAGKLVLTGFSDTE